MTIAIPLSEGRLSSHFGHCEQFALFQVEDQLVKNRKDLDPPQHEPGLLPRWLKEQGVDLVIAGGMGRRAQEIFRAAGVETICGADQQSPEEVVERYLGGRLEAGDNTCDH
jgi:predicted Fe-Mo cluster-binding NifX family protein